MLPDGSVLRNVYEELIPLCTSKTILVDCSTVDVESALYVSKEAEKNSIAVIDAPVSGGVVGAENGTLTFMVGGEKDAYDKQVGDTDAHDRELQALKDALHVNTDKLVL